MFRTDVGIDLGTANILVYVTGQGVVICESSVVAKDLDTGKICAIGEEARQMIGRTPGNIQAIRPLKNGVIADYEVTESMLKYLINKARGRRVFYRPRVVVCVPSGGTSVEKRAVMEATLQTGAREVYLISEPMAAAIGCGLDVMAPKANMVIDVGGGTTDVSVISLGGEVVSESLRTGGDHMEDAIIRHVKRAYNVSIGERTAEQIKIEIGSALPGEEKTMSIRGGNQVTGLPCTIELPSSVVYQSLEEPIRNIVDGIKHVLEIVPPELASDILNVGMVLTGGGALLHGLDELIVQETGVPVHSADDPMTCVARGCGMVLERLDAMRDSVLLSIKDLH